MRYFTPAIGGVVVALALLTFAAWQIGYQKGQEAGLRAYTEDQWQSTYSMAANEAWLVSRCAIGRTLTDADHCAQATAAGNYAKYHHQGFIELWDQWMVDATERYGETQKGIEPKKGAQ